MMRWAPLTGAFTVLACGCASLTSVPVTDNVATAELHTADGKLVGTATFTEVAGGIRVVLEIRGMPPGTKAVHVHEVGKCDPSDFASAGNHLNPDGKQHGLLNPAGPHAGDLPNISIGPDGTGRLETMNERLALRAGAALLDGDGSALVVHAAADDFTTDPAGGSGARIACGVIVRSRTGPEPPVTSPPRAPAR
jgi:Cu-Zn family superoxide dismutase